MQISQEFHPQKIFAELFWKSIIRLGSFLKRYTLENLGRVTLDITFLPTYNMQKKQLFPQ